MSVPLIMRKLTLHCYVVGICNTHPPKMKATLFRLIAFVFLIIIELPLSSGPSFCLFFSFKKQNQWMVCYRLTYYRVEWLETRFIFLLQSQYFSKHSPQVQQNVILFLAFIGRIQSYINFFQDI